MVVLDVPPHLKSIAALPWEIECSTAQLCIHISQNIVHTRLVRMIN